MDTRTLKGRIEYAMEKVGIKEFKDLAKRADVSRASIYVSIKQGFISTVRIQNKLAATLNVRPQWLIDGTGPMTTELQTTCGGRIRACRDAKGLTQAQLGEASNNPLEMIQAWEEDDGMPRGSERLRIGNALNVSYEWLRTGEGPMELQPIPEDRPNPALTPHIEGLMTRAILLLNQVIRDHGVEISEEKHATLQVHLGLQAVKDESLLNPNYAWSLVKLALPAPSEAGETGIHQHHNKNAFAIGKNYAPINKDK
jgi:transcriptional regulator with XRE-family HTH domain